MVNVYRRSLSMSDVGDFSENSDVLVYSSVPAAIRPVTSDAIYEKDGVEHFQTHRGFINKESGGTTINLALDDIIEDLETGVKHTVIGVQNFYPADSNLSNIHHIEVALEAIGETGKDLLARKTVSSKVKMA